MGDIVSALQGTPVPTILVLGGLLFVFLALGGKLSAGEIPPDRRKYFGIAGSIFILFGVILFVVPQRVSPDGNSATPLDQNIDVTVTPTNSSTETQQTQFDVIVATISALNQTADILYGPISGALTGEDDNSLECDDADVLVTNAIIKVQFIYPHQSESWTFGINFRHLGRNQQYRLFINQDGFWEVEWDRVNSDGNRIFTTIDGGRISNLIRGENASNELSLYVNEATAFFYLNEKFISDIEVSQVISPGDVAVCIEYKDDTVDLVLDYSDFTIWSLP